MDDGDGDDDNNNNNNEDNKHHLPSASICSADMPILGGADIAKIMSSNGPVVKCVLLRCHKDKVVSAKDVAEKANNKEEEDSKPAAKPAALSAAAASADMTKDDDNDSGEEKDAKSTLPNPRVILTDLIEEIELDTTPNKSMVQKTLGGKFTFLGQYHEEGIVLMVRDLPPNIQELLANEDFLEWEESIDNTDPMAVLSSMKVSDLRELCMEREIDTSEMVEKRDLVQALLNFDESLPPYNPHQLQPPLHKTRVRGDILIMHVAETKEELDNDDDVVDDNDEVGAEEKTEIDATGDKEDEKNEKKPAAKKESKKEKEEEDKKVDSDNKEEDENEEGLVPPTDEEFFLDYTKKEYIDFASRTDIEEHEIGFDDEEEEEEEEEGNDNGEEGDEELNDEDKNGLFNIVMSEVLRQYRSEMGRGPNTQELLEMRANIARELGVEIAEVEGGDWDQKAKADTPSSGKKIAFDSRDEVNEFIPHENEHNFDEDEDDEDYTEETNEPPAKKLKSAPPTNEKPDETEHDYKPTAAD